MKKKLFLGLIVLFLLPNLIFGQTPPDLGATSSFALFTAGGAFDSDGATKITGNIGSFTVTPAIAIPGTVNGTIFNMGDATLNQPFTDVSTAYADLFSRVPDDVIAIELAGQTLTPGVHSTGSGSAATLTGNVTLDGQGNPNAIFIIQIDDALAISAFSNVILINSASPNNVYWQIVGAFTLGNSSVFRGNIVSGGAIELLDASSLIGRGLTKAGAIHLHNNVVTLGTPPAAPTVILIQPTCSVGTGTITITAPTGIGMTYSIDGLTYTNSTGIFPSQANGTYNATAMDSDGYVSLRTTVIITSQPLPPANAIASTTIQSTCLVPTGTIVVTAPLGAGFEYNIDGGVYQTSVTFSEIAAGSHSILVRSTTDNTCISGATAVAVNAQPPTPIVMNQTISILTGGTFSVTPSGVPLGTTYTWIVPTYTGGVTGGIAESGQTDIHGTLNIPSGTGTATYTVTPTSGSCVGAIFTVIVTVTDSCVPVTIETQPADNSMCANSGNVTFTVVATGAAPFTYQWQYNNGGTWVNVANGNPAAVLYTNATTATLNVTGITTPGSFQYRSFITNCSGSNNATSNAVTLIVNPLPIPTITGLTAVSALSSTVYTTQAGMTDYIWSISTGGTITAGGTATDNTVTVTWNTSGAQTVSVNYNNASGCTAILPTVLPIIVGNLPIPTITGPTPVCVTSTNNVYVTEAGMTGYIWTVSAGGTITAGGTATDNTVTVTWDTLGVKTITVSYTNGGGYTAASPTSYNVTVVSLPVPTLSGPSPVCIASNGNVYTTEIGMTGYTWTVSAGGTTIFGGTSTDNTVTIAWNTAGAQAVSVNYTNANGCTAANPTVKTVIVNLAPSAPTYTLIHPNGTVTTGTITVTTPTGTGMTYSIDGLVYTNTTGIFTVLPGSYSITAMNSTGCISIPTLVKIVAANADLSVVKTVNNPHPIVGQNVVFTIVATNNGPNTATGVTVTDIIESGYTYVSATSTTGTYDASAGVWTIGKMINGASESLNITATVNSMGSYVNTATINGTENDGDTGNNTSTIITDPTDFFIPDGFSPNDDGTNDLFVIRGITNYPNNTFVIFNRWGNKVYESSPYQNSWDGRSMFGLRVGGNELPIGTYFYVLDLKDGSAIFKGTIYLNR